MSTWDGKGFNKLANLGLRYRDSSSSSSCIYANGRNQVAITISVVIYDSNNEPLKLEAEELKDLIYFNNPSDGGSLHSGLHFSDTKGEYEKPISFSNQFSEENTEGPELQEIEPRAGEIYITKYLDCSENYLINQFSVGINIPGVGKFDTSNNGTNTLNGPNGETGGPFKSPQALNIYTQPAINYGSLENVQIENQWDNIYKCQEVVGDMAIYKNNKKNPTYNGSSRVNYMLIRPKDNIKFKHKNVKRNRVSVPNMMNLYGYKSTDSNGVETFGENGYTDILWGRGIEAFDTSLIFIETPKCGIVHTEDKSLNNKGNGIRTGNNSNSYFYKISTNDTRHVFPGCSVDLPKISDEYILVVMCNHATLVKNIKKSGWENTPSNGVALVEVFDEFGNTGNVKISMADVHWPLIKVNQ